METSACQIEDFCCLQVGHEGECSESIFPFRLVIGTTDHGVVSTRDVDGYVHSIGDRFVVEGVSIV